MTVITMPANFFSLFNRRKYIILILMACFFTSWECWPDSAEVYAQSADAIGVRTVSNPEHISPLEWYRQNIKIQGSPQSITIDGYYAIRDGRTVYINIGNIAGNSLYTNIYVISFNQKAERNTEDIFGSVLEHLKFNRNIRGLGICSDDSESACAIDYDCLGKGFCLRAQGGGTVKAEIVRDVRRLADLAYIKSLAENYRSANKTYPRLAAGTYLPFKTISVWPSWKETLSKIIGQELPVDPINRLGSCGAPRFAPETCWDENSKTFAATYPNTPDNSRAYLFYTSENARNFTVCAVMESGFINDLADGACPGSETYIGGDANHAPTIPSSFIGAVHPGEEFTASILAYDEDNDPLIWTINTGMSSWTGWPQPPALANTLSPYTKRVFASQAGDIGAYSFSVMVSDPDGLSAVRTFVVNVSAAICEDHDNDGFGNPGSIYCSRPETDCDDSAPGGSSVNPGASENCANGIDDDCDSLIDANDPACAACNGICDGSCPAGCTAANDPDCGCSAPNNCCGISCSRAQDADCAITCGDQLCASGESCLRCSADCGVCPNSCGDGFCDISCGECAECPADCPSGTPGC